MHDHSHAGHAHHGGHPPRDFGRAFAIGIALNLVFVVVEAGFGFFSNSMALIADAGHNLSDVLGLVIAWIGVALARRAPTRQFTYGYRRSTILAALINALVLLVAVGGICWEAIARFADPPPVAGWTVILVASAGIVINTATALLFVAGRKSDLNIRGAFLHMAADAAVSGGVVVGGLVILLTGYHWIDPVASLVIAVVIVAGTWGLLRDAVRMTMDAVPASIDPQAVRAYLADLPGVSDVHDLHIWSMSTTETALTAHLVMPGGQPPDSFLADIAQILAERFGIGHPTLQIEADGNFCRFARSEVV